MTPALKHQPGGPVCAVDAAEQFIPLVARHEASHCVVAVALGLPLASVEISGSRIRLGDGRSLRLAGCTHLAVSASENWRRDWRDPAARETLANEAIMSAAGIVSDSVSGARLGDRGARTDVFKCVRIGGMLGIGASIEEEPVRRFLAECIDAAAEILKQRDCEAWNAVAHAVCGQTALTGDQVRACVAAVGSGEARRTLPGQRGVQALPCAFPQEYSRLALSLGGNVRAADVEYAIDVTVRLLKMERDLLNPTNTRLTLSNRPVRLSSMLTPAGKGR